MKPVEFDAEAEAELFVAAAWYRERDPALPARLFDEVGQVADDIGRLPKRYPALRHPQHEPPIRRARLRRFPYSLVFIELDERVRVLALAHLKRRPLYWATRLRTPDQGE